MSESNRKKNSEVSIKRNNISGEAVNKVPDFKYTPPPPPKKKSNEK